MQANVALTRRAAVTQAGPTAKAASRARATVQAAEANPDAALIEMVAALAAATKRRRALDVVVSERMERCAYPPPPSSLYFRPADQPNICDDPDERCEQRLDVRGENRFYDDQTALTLRARRLWSAGDGVVDLGFTKAERARILEMKAAHERWQADIARAEGEAGITGPAELAERESEIIDELVRKIAATPAQTLEGRAAKGRALGLAQGSTRAALTGQLAHSQRRDF